MKIYKINNDYDFLNLIKDIKPHKFGINLMQKKANLHYFYIKNLKRVAANILKQDALSCGAELVTSKDTIFGGSELENALLIVNDKQREILIKKAKMQDFGLKNLSLFLSNNFTKPKFPKLMGVLNFNTDSFNPSSRASVKDAIFRIESMIEQGASYIDIGAVSSRPGSEYPGGEVEFERLREILDEIYKNRLFERVKFSLDSFDEKCLRYALNRGFSLINDISGNLDLIKLAKEFDAHYCLMHMKGSPKDMQNDTKYDDILSQIDDFFAKGVQICDELGFKNLILDVGIGFGKSARDNLFLIKNLEHFLHFQKPLLVGASMKSMIDFFSPSEVKDRLAGTLFLHQKAFENGAEILRVHDVFSHKQHFDLNLAYNNLGF